MVVGRHCCLWCLITAKDMNVPKFIRPTAELRTLDNLKQHHTQFCNEFNHDSKSAKKCFNVIDEVQFNIPIEQVNRYLPKVTRKFKN